jgi:peptidoglycan/LPS O-acetylase OafA/YrhL
MAGAVVFILYATAILVVGAMLHYAVERPFLRWRDLSAPAGSGTTTAAATA